MMNYLHTGQHNSKTYNYITYQKNIIILSLIICLILHSFNGIKIVKADSTNRVNVRVDYLEEIIVVTPGTGGSTKFYMSLDNKKTWEIIDGTGVVDISTLLSSKEVTLYFKGNKDLEVIDQKLTMEDDSLQVSYQVLNGAGVIAFSSLYGVEYKKGVNGDWKTATNYMPTAPYEIKGATLFFRTTASTGKRAGKVKTVKIPKRPSAPSIKLDASKLIVTGLKPGETQYRVGDSPNWLTFNPTDLKSKSLSLSSLLSPTTGTNAAIPAGSIEFRSVGNVKKVNSSVKLLEIPIQPTVPENITLTDTTLRINDVNTKRAYEYAIVPKNSIFNIETAKWSSQVTSKAPVIIKNAAVGDKILVRLKSTTDPTSKQIILASTYKEFVVTQITIPTR